MSIDPAASRSKPSWPGHVLRIAFGAVAIWLLVRTGALEPALLGAALKRHPLLCLLALISYAVIIQGFAYVRWLWLLRRARVSISSRQVLRLHLIGIFFNGLLPGGTGGDLVKGYYLLRGRDSVEGSAALGTMVVDRFAGLFGLLLLGVTANLWSRELLRESPLLAAQAMTYLGITVGIALLSGVFFSPWKPRWLQKAAEPGSEKKFWKGFLASLVAFRDAPRVFVGVTLLSAAVHFGLVVVYALCARALEVGLPFSGHAYVVPTLTLLNGIPLSPAGLGIGEAGGAVLYKAAGATHGFTEVPALVHAVILLTALLCSPAYFWRWEKKRAIGK
jgi:uncharacterized protein (TIRG00374 family)